MTYTPSILILALQGLKRWITIIEDDSMHGMATETWNILVVSHHSQLSEHQLAIRATYNCILLLTTTPLFTSFTLLLKLYHHERNAILW